MNFTSDKSRVKRERIRISGIVQGVGFRPFVYNLADKLNIKGFVTNTREGVLIEAEGERINEFIESLSANAPPLSEIEKIHSEKIAPLYSKNFEIVKSENSLGNKTLISPDVSICGDCLTELLDKTDRRFLYPFINCTNCGPRFTIIENIPYDRPQTTMKKFTLCESCKSEYENPADRRFHAQPNACHKCGPSVRLKFGDIIIGGNEKVFETAAQKILNGEIGAVKGLGGFHLCCSADDESAIEKLRERKRRPSKPLAVMTPDLETAETAAHISKEEKKILSSKERPILLLKKKSALPDIIAPDNGRIGIMLPYTPLHYILFYFLKKLTAGKKRPALIMTSANISEEPICITNEDAEKRLSGIADFYLFHNRDILIRADDSVGIVINEKLRIIRRSRGYVPKRIKLRHSGGSILAVGAELKNTICLTKGCDAFISQHIGNLTNLRAYGFFEETVEHLQKIMDADAETVVCDLHPNYLSTKWAENSGTPPIKIQHHHAHLASCMAENNLDENVIGLILDGTGYGYDSKIWGGEILFGDYTHAERIFHLRYMPLPGGDAAVKEPWRTAAAYLHCCLPGAPVPERLKNYPVDTIRQMIDKKINSPLTSSAGRLFDAVAALAGGPREITFEAEAAVHLTNAAASAGNIEGEYSPPELENGEIKIERIISDVYADAMKNVSYQIIAAKFHNTLISVLCRAVEIASELKSVKKVALSGGAFQNEILLAGIENRLKKNGFEVYTHSIVPCGDGGISLGQAAAAAKLISENQKDVSFIK